MKTEAEIEAVVKKILADDFEVDASSITSETNLFTELDLDSIDAVDLVDACWLSARHTFEASGEHGRKGGRAVEKAKRDAVFDPSAPHGSCVRLCQLLITVKKGIEDDKRRVGIGFAVDGQVAVTRPRLTVLVGTNDKGKRVGRIVFALHGGIGDGADGIGEGGVIGASHG